MNRSFILIFFVLLFLGIIAWAFSGDDIKVETTYRYKQILGKTTQVQLNGHSFDVEVAVSDQDRAQGLSNRDRLRDNTGMLFVFAGASAWGFWMKDTRVTLDIIWINDGKIVDIAERLEPAADIDNPPTYIPVSPARFVVELLGGSVDLYDIMIGQDVTIHNIDKFTD